MRIIELNIPVEKCENYKLKPVKMSRLGQVVVIAGRNGAGKTRCLRLIKDIYQNYKGIGIKELKQALPAMEKEADELIKAKIEAASAGHDSWSAHTHAKI